MASVSLPSTAFAMTPDQIFITDVGVDNSANTFYWLAIGRYVYDHNFNEITMRDLERVVDPNDAMNPIFLRGDLWKTLPSRLWQVDDGHQLGPIPAQPGLDARLSSKYNVTTAMVNANIQPAAYYENRRTKQEDTNRQTGEYAELKNDVSQHCDGLVCRDLTRKPKNNGRRTRSCGNLRGRRRDYGTGEHYEPRRHSADSHCDSISSAPSTPQSETSTDEDRITLEHDSHPQYPDASFLGYTRKSSIGLDSGVDLGYCSDWSNTEISDSIKTGNLKREKDWPSNHVVRG